jgi:hypothetical protein
MANFLIWTQFRIRKFKRRTAVTIWLIQGSEFELGLSPNSVYMSIRNNSVHPTLKRHIFVVSMKKSVRSKIGILEQILSLSGITRQPVGKIVRMSVRVPHQRLKFQFGSRINLFSYQSKH